MTQDEIIRMAREAGILEPIDLLPSNQWRQDTIRELERFAALVAEAKKQQLIDLCEREIEKLSIDNDEGHVSRFDEGLYAAYHTILKVLLA